MRTPDAPLGLQETDKHQGEPVCFWRLENHMLMAWPGTRSACEHGKAPGEHTVHGALGAQGAVVHIVHAKCRDIVMVSLWRNWCGLDQPSWKGVKQRLEGQKCAVCSKGWFRAVRSSTAVRAGPALSPLAVVLPALRLSAGTPGARRCPPPVAAMWTIAVSEHERQQVSGAWELCISIPPTPPGICLGR